VDKCKPLPAGDTRAGGALRGGADRPAAGVRAARAGALLGRAVQVDRIEPTLKPSVSKRLKLQCDILLSTSASTFNLRRYTSASASAAAFAFSLGGGGGGGEFGLGAVGGKRKAAEDPSLDARAAVVRALTPVRRCRLTLSDPR